MLKNKREFVFNISPTTHKNANNQMQCKLMIWLCTKKTAQNLSISLIIHYKRNHGDNEENIQGTWIMLTRT